MLWPHYLESFHLHSWRWIISLWFNEKKANFLCFTYILKPAGEISHSYSFYTNDLYYYHKGIATFSLLCCKFSLFLRERSVYSLHLNEVQWPVPYQWLDSSSFKTLTKWGISVIKEYFCFAFTDDFILFFW